MTTKPKKDIIDPKTHDYSKDPRIQSAKQTSKDYAAKRAAELAERETIKAQVKKEILAQHKADRIEAIKKAVRPEAERELRQEGKLGAFV